MCLKFPKEQFQLFVICITCLCQVGPGKTETVRNESDILRAAVEVRLTCDMEFAKNFEFDDTLITRFWNYQVQALNLDFGGLDWFQVSFRINTIAILKTPEEQDFVEIVRNENGSVEITNLLGSFVNVSKSWDSNSNFKVHILATGSYGTPLDHVLFKTTVGCSSTKQNAIVVRVTKTAWFNEFQLNSAFSEILSGKSDAGIGKNKWADYSIRKRKADDAFRNVACYQNYDNDSDTKIAALSTVTAHELCQIRHPSENLQETDVNCEKTRCVSKAGKFLGFVYPNYNVPCGKDKICIWGSCADISYELQHHDSGLCLDTTDNPSYRHDVNLQPCRGGYFQSQKINFLPNGLLKARVALGDAGMWMDYGCLTVKGYSKFRLGLDKNCERPGSSSEESVDLTDYKWKLIPYESGNFIVLFHVKTSQYLFVNKTNSIQLSYDFMTEDSRYLWKFRRAEGIFTDIEIESISPLQPWKTLVVLCGLAMFSGLLVIFVVCLRFKKQPKNVEQQMKGQMELTEL